MKILENIIEIEKQSLSYETLNRLKALEDFISQNHLLSEEFNCLNGELLLENKDVVVKVSDKFIALLLKVELFEEFDLPKILLSDLGIPDLKTPKVKIRLIGNFREEKFRLKLDLYNENDEKLYKDVKNGINIKFDNGEEYYLSPFLSQLIDLCELKYNHSNFNERVAVYSRAKSLLRHVTALQDDFIKREELLYLDKPEFTIGKDINGNVILKEVLPLQYTYFDKSFQFDDQELNLDNVYKFTANQKTLRVMLSEETISLFKKIQIYRSKGQEFLREIIESPEDYFTTDELNFSFVSDVELNRRITGFSFESKTSGRFNDSTDNNWSNGLDISSVYLYAKDGNSHQFNTENILEDYIEIKKVLSQVGLDEVVLPKFEGTFDRNDLERLCEIIENKFDPDVNEFNFDEIKSMLEEAYSKDFFYVEIDDVCVPTESLKRNLDNAQKTSSESKAIIVEIAEEFGGKASIEDINSSDLFFDTNFFKGNIELRDHQKVFLSHALSLFNYSSDKDNKLGLLLADDMGLGKTIQAISFIFNVKTNPKYKDEPILIVAPVSLLDTSWIEDGFKKFIDQSILSEHKVALLTDFKGKMSKGQVRFEVENIDQQIKEGVSPEKLELTAAFASYIKEFTSWCDGKIILVSYELLRSRVIELLFVKFSLIVLDEAQKVKNVNTAQTNAAKSLQSRFNLALTGTPIENSLIELWSIMDFVSPGHLGYLNEFKQNFVAPLASLDTGDPNRLTLAKKLEEELLPLWIRRLKKDIAKELPEIIHGEYLDNSEIKNNDDVVISEEQKRLYLEGLNYFKSAKKGAQLQGVRLLLETCFAPWRAKRLDVNYSNKDELFLLCPKIRKTMDILEAIWKRNEKVIIFANVVDVQYDLQAFIEDYFKNEHGIILDVDVFNGKASKIKRSHYIEKFKKTAGFGVIIISPKAGGVGLNLVEANNVIHYTREWNPALEKQATDRVYRIGQKKVVNVYYPVTISDDSENPTAEQKLASLLCRKREVIDDFTVVPGENIINISDIQDIKDDAFDDYRITHKNIEIIDHNLLEALYAVIFEKLGYKTQCVGGAGEMGADVVGFGNENVLIQVKYTSKPSIGYRGIQEITAASKIYSDKFNKKFTLYTATNKSFNDAALTVAGLNEVKLLDFKFLLDMLSKFEIMRSELDKKLEDREVII